MRKAILIAFISLTLLSPIASYSIAIPDRIGMPYVLISDDGNDTLSLDDTVWYRKWQGLLIEQTDSSIYMVTDQDGDSLVIANNRAALEKLRNAIRFYDVKTLLYSGMPAIPAESLAKEGITQALLMERLTEEEEAIYEENGISFSYIRPGDIVDIDNDSINVEQIGEEGIIVICPHCKNSFTIFPDQIYSYIFD